MERSIIYKYKMRLDVGATHTGNVGEFQINSVYYLHFRGTKTKFQINNLAPCTLYNFRIKYLSDESQSDWLYFKSATETLQYFVMHVTRAVKFGKKSVIRKIVTNRPTLLECVNKEGKTPLIQAIEQDDLQMVTFLLNIGANVNNSTLITKRTPLMVALFRNNIHISNLLISKGGDASAVDCNNLTAFHYAVDSNIINNVELCIQHKFNINASDNKGWTPLIRAVILNCCDEILLLLLKNGADASLKDKRGFDFKAHLKINNRCINEEEG
ncbi:hypothetical protein RI129_005767 [Pyrocoelia pectoralis]|uniref:Uncharacterized protein n=1 Tax=Pyrocoelia pectoralis TaxID=417401 RepID=A0AAN7ZJ81_9COLE